MRAFVSQQSARRRHHIRCPAAWTVHHFRDYIW